mmetsp:Transcript_36584/g.86914  ORF Transcript_36584/g.86914 Transcript_36584/m.86914 type:complete len:232 (-) Transcript_36584:457-1152(-)
MWRCSGCLCLGIRLCDAKSGQLLPHRPVVPLQRRNAVEKRADAGLDLGVNPVALAQLFVHLLDASLQEAPLDVPVSLVPLAVVKLRVVHRGLRLALLHLLREALLQRPHHGLGFPAGAGRGPQSLRPPAEEAVVLVPDLLVLLKVEGRSREEVPELSSLARAPLLGGPPGLTACKAPLQRRRSPPRRSEGHLQLPDRPVTLLEHSGERPPGRRGLPRGARRAVAAGVGFLR